MNTIFIISFFFFLIIYFSINIYWTLRLYRAYKKAEYKVKDNIEIYHLLFLTFFAGTIFWIYAKMEFEDGY